MKRWKRALPVLAAALLLAGCAGQAAKEQTALERWRALTPEAAQVQQEPLVLTLTHSSGRDSLIDEGAACMKSRLELISGGSMSLEIYPEDTLGSLEDALQGFSSSAVDLRIGVADAAYLSYILWLPLLEGMTPEQVDACLAPGAALRQTVDALEEEGALLTLEILPSQYRLLASQSPVQNRQDLAALHMRCIGTSGLEKRFWSSLCASVQDINVQKLYLAFQQGLVDSCENTLLNLREYHLDKQVAYITDTQFKLYCDSIYVNRARFEALEPQQQDWVQDAAHYAAQQIAGRLPEYQSQVRQQMEAGGITFLQMDPAERAAICADSRALVRDTLAESIGRDTLDRLEQALGAGETAAP